MFDEEAVNSAADQLRSAGIRQPRVADAIHALRESGAKQPTKWASILAVQHRTPKKVVLAAHHIFMR